jgi:glycolate oxidase FAD binding subunit
VSDARTESPASTAEVVELMRSAATAGATVLVRGAGTTLHWGGSPSHVDIELDTRALTGVVAHEPGDLVATVRAGMSLVEFQQALGVAGQRLSLSAGSSEATVGGVLASGEAGPLRLRYGPGRDLLIGVEFVRADGVVARSGGRVVKNVAGYDLGKLLCGSYGTLAIITSATFRLHPRPRARAWVVTDVPALSELDGPLRAAATSTVVPSAVEIDLPGPGPAGALAVMIEGSPAGVDARCAALQQILPGSTTSTAPPEWWGRYPFGPEDVALRLSAGVASLPAAIAELRSAAGTDLPVRGSAGVGVVHAALPGDVGGDALRETVTAARAGAHVDGSVVVLAAPPHVRDALDLWGPVPGLDLMHRVKAQFDPDGRFVSGRFVGGI